MGWGIGPGGDHGGAHRKKGREGELPSRTMGGGLPLATIARVVAISVVKLVFAGGISAWSFRQLRASNKVPNTLLKDVSQFNKELLLPCFIFVNVAEGLTGDLVAQLFFVPVFVALCMGAGYVAGRAAAFITRAPRSQYPVAMTMVTFSNVIGLPLPLLMSLIDGVPQLAETVGSHSRGSSYLFLANVLQSTVMWTLAGPMLAGGRKAERKNSIGPMLGSGTARSDAETPSTTELSSTPAAHDAADQQTPQVEPTPALSQADGGADSHGAGPVEELAAPDEVGISSANGASPVASAPARAWLKVRRAATLCGDALPRPSRASLLGLIVGVTPLRDILVTEDAPLRWVLDAMELIGAGAVPLVIFVLGATLSKGPAGAGGAMPVRTIVGVLFAKLVVVPSITLGLLMCCVQAGLVPLGDGLLPITLLIVGASPTAMNINVIATLQGTGQKEVASIMFYQYLLAIISVSVVASVGLLIFL